MAKKEYLLSICIPTYNRGQCVYECVKKCLETIDTNDVEVVVSDNCSDDGTYEMMMSIKDERFSYYRNEKNIGYPNIMYSVKRAKGRFALLISDEDEIEAYWPKVFQQLSVQKSVVMRCIHRDSEGNILVKGPNHIFENMNDKYSVAINDLGGYCSGIVFDSYVIKKVWEKIDKNSYQWSLYPHHVASMYVLKHGAYGQLDWIEVNERKQEQDIFCDTLAWKGAESSTKEEPYWCANSRLLQCKDMMIIIDNLKLKGGISRLLLDSLCKMGIRDIANYYTNVLHNPVLLDSLLKKKEYDSVLQELKGSKMYWCRYIIKNAVSLRKKANHLLKKHGKCRIRSFSYFLSVAKSMTMVMKHKISKQI